MTISHARPTVTPSEPANIRPLSPAEADRLARDLGTRFPTPRGARRFAEALNAAPNPPATPESSPDAAPIPEAVAEHAPRVAYWAAALMTIVVFGGLILYVGVAASRRGDAPLGYLAGLSLLAMGCGVLWAMHAEGAPKSQGGRRGGEASPLRSTADGANAHATHDASRPPALVRPRLQPPGGRRLDVVG